MNNQTLLNISLIISIIGILILLILTNTVTPKQVKIKDIDEDSLNNIIQTKGFITSVKTYTTSDFQVVTINDSAGKIDVTIDNPINITKNQSITVIGKVTLYNDNPQIQAEKIIKN